MQTTCCKLRESIQRKLLESFIFEVRVGSAADMLDIHPNSAELFYRKIRQVISPYLSWEANEIFAGQERQTRQRRGSQGSDFLVY